VTKGKGRLPRSRVAYPSGLRAELLKRVAEGESPEELAKRFEPTAQTIRNWVAAEAKRQVKGSDGRSLIDLEKENQDLRRQSKDERESVEILKKRRPGSQRRIRIGVRVHRSESGRVSSGEDV
jgi:transposase